MSAPLLEVRDLRVTIATDEGLCRCVDGVGFSLRPGEVLGIVGESGSGKSQTAMSIPGLNRGRNVTLTGGIGFHGRDLLQASEDELRELRGGAIAMILQDPMAALNPVYRVGDQIAEQIRTHQAISRRAAQQRVVELFKQVGISDAAHRSRQYPHQLSGGMCQRAVIAMALSCEPEIIIADEPTTACDVTVQAQVLDLLDDMRREAGSAVILITHDLGVVSSLADQVVVMYGGKVVERADKHELFSRPRHPYTWGLLGSSPRLEGERPRRLTAIPGAPPSPFETIEGCGFAARCAHASERCREPLTPLDPEHEGHCDCCVLDDAAKRALAHAARSPVETRHA
jgi:oligopeptide/dipeptide ABC transporter ATP-binding protein